MAALHEIDQVDAIRSLADQFAAGFPLARPGVRTIGREAEYPVVTARGEAADVRRLWEVLMADGDLVAIYEQGRPGRLQAP